jgi:hypothetical protein
MHEEATTRRRDATHRRGELTDRKTRVTDRDFAFRAVRHLPAFRFCFANLEKINRKPELLEPPVSCRKQSTVTKINRKPFKVSRFPFSHSPNPPVTGLKNDPETAISSASSTSSASLPSPTSHRQFRFPFADPQPSHDLSNSTPSGRSRKAKVGNPAGNTRLRSCLFGRTLPNFGKRMGHVGASVGQIIAYWESHEWTRFERPMIIKGLGANKTFRLLAPNVHMCNAILMGEVRS